MKHRVADFGANCGVPTPDVFGRKSSQLDIRLALIYRPFMMWYVNQT
jgi:hypothetical protein